ncbi:MAG TPA: hypothetical protein PK002_01620 [Cellvibrio sp.]|nr:hypothetical protein [Cellvibrio sp.]
MQRKISMFHGYTFVFNQDGKQIEAWFSALSGLEKVSVDGVLVSKRRNLSINSKNVFAIGGDNYATSLQAVNVLAGPFVCTLIKNNKAVKRQKLLYSASNSKWPLFLIILFGFIGGFNSLQPVIQEEIIANP